LEASSGKKLMSTGDGGAHLQPSNGRKYKQLDFGPIQPGQKERPPSPK
jgi:hypothetical protein